MTSGPSRPSWRDTLAPFATPSTGRGLLAVTTSAVPYLALTAALYATLGVSLPLTIALTILAAYAARFGKPMINALLVFLFLIFRNRQNLQFIFRISRLSLFNI